MKTIVAAAFSFFYIALPGSMGAVPQQEVVRDQQSDSKKVEAERLKKPTKYSDVPAKGEFENNSNELGSDQQRRVVRESRYKGTYAEITDPANSTAQEPSEDYVVQISDCAAPLDPFPVAPAAAIVIGTVLRGKAFVSSDRTYVYPDYQVRVDRVLKQDTSASLAVGEQIVVSRGGGAIHF
ncbi:MAG TPA: hypothetical protein VK818_07100 [Methylomirabilota bacterium]|jgi:hypothetical protein|nr:hypothetical protein [Methylomirabilota bacterium]